MNKNEAEKVIKDTIVYANDEIERNKKKSLKIIFFVFGIFIFLVIAYFVIFKYEIPVKYSEKLINVKIPNDGGIDIYVNSNNYKRLNAVLVKTDDNTYDLYINVASTVFTKIVSDNDESDNMLRVGNGIIVDFNSGELMGYIPNGNKSEVIKSIYYVNNLKNKFSSMDDNKLINYKDKILVWSR